MYKEAIEDGIRIEEPVKQGGVTKYFPKCCICGKEVLTFNYRRGIKYTCRDCKVKKVLHDRETKINEDFDLKERKFNNAVTRIKGMTAYTQDYKRAADIIHKKLHRPLWFQSTEEIMVAIQLVKDKIPARHQVKYGPYRADFVLPNEKIVLEVDGVVFHNERTATKESMRDSLITLALGPEWEVVRITDEMINENITKLMKAIHKVKKHRKLLRAQNGGAIPTWYSKKIV